jgi:hypothetical protein
MLLLWGSRLTMNELAMYFAPRRVDDGYLEVLIVAQASIPKMLGQNAAMGDGVGIGREIDPDSVPEGDAVDHIEEKLRHGLPPIYQSGVPPIVPE